MILVIDNYDSFTYNLVQYLGELGAEVTVMRNTLTIAGEKPGPAGVPAERFHRSERAAGRFVRTVELPTEVDADGVRAQYRNGLLLVTVPRAASARPRRVTVEAG